MSELSLFIENEKEELSLKTVKKMYEQAGEEIAQMWGKLQTEKVIKDDKTNEDL